MIGKGLMIGLDGAEVIEVVDHQPGTLAQAFGRGVTEPIQPLEASPVAEVKAGDRVERLAILSLGAEKIGRCKAHQQRAEPLCEGLVLVPAGRVQERERCRIQTLKPGSGWISGHTVEPGAEARRRRKGDEGLKRGQVTGEILHNLLDQEVAERDPTQTWLAVANGIEG